MGCLSLKYKLFIQTTSDVDSDERSYEEKKKSLKHIKSKHYLKNTISKKQNWHNMSQ